MDYSQHGNGQYGNNQYNHPPGYLPPQQYAQQQQYQPTPPQIRNPFAPPQSAASAAYPGQQIASYDPEHEAELAQWQSAYAPQEQQDKARKGGRPEKGENPNLVQVGARAAVENADVLAKPAEGDKQKTVMRKGGGQSWEDKTLLEWDPTQFRIMVGNLAGEVTDESLAKAFSAYGVSKARVIRDKLTTKSRGFGFVSFTDGEQGFKAARDMVGKYIGSHPVTIQRSKADIRPVVQKDRYKGKNHKNNKNNKNRQKQDDPLRASTGAHIEKKAVRNPTGMKVLG